MNPSRKNVCIGRCSFVGNLLKEHNPFKGRQPYANAPSNRKTILFVVGIVQLEPPSKWPNTNWECNILLYHDRTYLRVPTVGFEFQPKRARSNSTHITCFSGSFNEHCRLSKWSVFGSDWLWAKYLFVLLLFYLGEDLVSEQKGSRAPWKGSSMKTQTSYMFVYWSCGGYVRIHGRRLTLKQKQEDIFSLGICNPFEFICGRDVALVEKCTANTSAVWSVLASLE